MKQGSVMIGSLAPYEVHLTRSYGDYRIPACPEGKPYVLVEIENKSDHLWDAGNEEYRPYPVEARKIAEDLVNQGDPTGKHGLFICSGATPSKADLEKAQERRRVAYERLVRQADVDWARFRGQHQHISDEQRRAALSLGLDREWAYKIVPQVDCPGCGETVKATVAFCKHCLTIINEEAYRKLKTANEYVEASTKSKKQEAVIASE